MKKVTLVLALLLAVAMLFSACEGRIVPKKNDLSALKWSNELAFERAQELGYEGTLDEFLAQLQGAPGEPGKDGVGISTLLIDSEGKLVVVLTNGQTVNLGVVKGEKGEKGDPGVGIAKTEINNQGELIITLTDGTENNLGKVVGQNGKDGDKGDTGVGVASVEFDQNGDIVVVYTNGKTEVKHMLTKLQSETPPTCGDYGEIEIYGCALCHRYFDAEENELTITKEDDTLIPPTGKHTYGNWIAETATTKGHYQCSVCGKNFDENYNELDGIEKEEEDLAPLPKADYSSKTYTILYRQGQRYEEEWIGESGSPDVISASIALRNQKVQNRYGVTLDFDTGRTTPDWSEFWRKVTVNTTDDIYQLIAGQTYQLAGSSVQGYCLNWLNSEQIPVVNLEKEWWDGEFTRAASYKNCSYIATGPLSLTDMYSSACIFFNKRLLNNALDYKSDDSTADLYNLVKEGRWTLDKLIEYAANCTDAVEGAEDASIYGLSSNFAIMIDAYIYASNLTMTQRKNGTIVLTAVNNNNPIIVLSNKLKAFYNESGSVKKENYDLVDTFVAGKSVFTTGDLSCAKTIQVGAEDLQYGVIPYPKLNEAQEKYHTYKLDYRTGFCIPRTVAEDNREFVGTITEALAYYSNKYVKPALYEKVLKHQNVQDQESSECVTMILDGCIYDFANIYAYAWGDMQSPVHLLIKVVQNNTNYKTQYDAQKDNFQYRLDLLLDSFVDDFGGSDVPEHEHTYSYVGEISATTGSAGMKEHYYCDDCGALFDMDYNEVTEKELTIPKLPKVLPDYGEDTWDGTANIQWYLDALEEDSNTKEFYLRTAEDLAGFSYLVNAYYVNYTSGNTEYRSCYDGLWYDTATGEVLGFRLSGEDGTKEFDYGKLGFYNPRPDGIMVGEFRVCYTNNVGKYYPEFDYTVDRVNPIDGSAYIAGDDFKEKTVYLLADLIMNDTTNFAGWDTERPANVWMPIGGGRNVNATFPHFEGFFRGEGHTIEGLYFSAPEDMEATSAGLFGHMARSGAAKVQDVIVEKSFFRCSSQVAGICGRTDNVLSVINCHVRNTVIYAYSNNAGGIVGSVHGGSITLNQCSVTDIKVQAIHTVGALVASANFYGLLARDCLATGEIEAKNESGDGGWDIGIVVGRVGNSTVMVMNFISVVKVTQTVTGSRKDYSGTCGVIWGAVAKHGSTGEEFKSTAKASKCYYVDLFETNGEILAFQGPIACEKYEIQGLGASVNISGFNFYDEATNPTGIWGYGEAGQYPYLMNAGKVTAETEEEDPGTTEDHVHDHPVAAKAATCTEAGNVFYYDCSICGHPVDEFGEEIDPVIPASGHKLKEKAEKAATATADGMQAHYQCEKCGAYFDMNKNEVKKADLVIPKTGKSGCGGVIVGAPVVAIVVLGATMLMKKKENESK